MSKYPLLFPAVVAFLFAAAGCDSAFDPRGPYTERLVVYSVLSTRTDTQYVRVYTTYNPSGFNPLEVTAETVIRGAEVTMTEGGVTTRLRDTVVARDDRSRYETDIPAYVAHPFPVQPGKTYQLTVRAPDRGEVTAVAAVPSRGTVTVVNPHVIRRPEIFDEDIVVYVSISPLAKGILVRFYLDYDLNVNGVWSPRRLEVPSAIIGAQAKYPRLTRRTTNPGTGRLEDREAITFSTGAFTETVRGLVNRYSLSMLRFTQAVFILTQVDPHLYNYYSIVNGFQDEYSIRTDLPDYTNIRGGLGVFGSLTDDSTSVDLLAK